MVFSPTEEAAKLRGQLGKGVCICILGGTKFSEPASEDLIKALAQKLGKSVSAAEAYFVTGGMPGVQKTFAEHSSDSMRVFNLLPAGEASGFRVGNDVHAGANLDERKAIFGQLGDVYVTVEGGPGVAQEARDAQKRGALVLPLIRTGGASGGMFEFPAAALSKPGFATEAQWALLKDKEASVDASADAIAAMVKAFLSKQGGKLARKAKVFGSVLFVFALAAVGFMNGLGNGRPPVPNHLDAHLPSEEHGPVELSGTREGSQDGVQAPLVLGGLLFLTSLIASVAWASTTRSRERREQAREQAGDYSPLADA